MLPFLFSALAFGSHISPFAVPQMPSEPVRLALTPTLDGKLEDSEWDEFAESGGKTYLQWEHGCLYAAAELPPGTELVLSLDLHRNGWLVGEDNLEIRVGWNDQVAVVRVRRLDCTDRAGPKWASAPGFEQAAEVAGSWSGHGSIVELRVVDPGLGDLPGDTETFGVRVEAAALAPIAPSDLPPYLPRAMAECRLDIARATNVPGGLKWTPQIGFRWVRAGDRFAGRMTFEGANSLGLAKVEVAATGAGSSSLARVESPFPAFDSKGRCFVDYATPIPDSMQPGYRVLSTKVFDAQGHTAVFRSSFRVVPAVLFDAVFPKDLRASSKPQTARVPLNMRTYSPRRIRGTYDLKLPGGWAWSEGGDRKITTSGMGGNSRRVLSLQIPAGAKGCFPIKFIADLEDGKVEQTLWVSLG